METTTLRTSFVLLVLAAPLGCASGDDADFNAPSDDDDAASDDDATAGDEDTASDDDTVPGDDDTTGTSREWHLLASSDGWNGSLDQAFTEFDSDGMPTWSLSFADNWAAEGFVRMDDGATLLVRRRSEGESAYLEEVDPDGNVIWQYSDGVAGPLGHPHGVAITPAGDWVVCDTDNDRVFAMTPQGEVLWQLTALPDGTPLPDPNGIDIRDLGAQGVHMLLSMRGAVESPQALPSLVDYRLGGRTDTPTLEWGFPKTDNPGALTLAHGPRLLSDGHRMVCSAGNGDIVGLSKDGDEVWRFPPDHASGSFVTPRDAFFLPDGRLVVADSSAGKIYFVSDPFGAFEMGVALPMPGVFRADFLDCEAGDGCLGP